MQIVIEKGDGEHPRHYVPGQAAATEAETGYRKAKYQGMASMLMPWATPEIALALKSSMRACRFFISE